MTLQGVEAEPLRCTSSDTDAAESDSHTDDGEAKDTVDWTERLKYEEELEEDEADAGREEEEDRAGEVAGAECGLEEGGGDGVGAGLGLGEPRGDGGEGTSEPPG